jgi:hypothetical protein
MQSAMKMTYIFFLIFKISVLQQFVNFSFGIKQQSLTHSLNTEEVKSQLCKSQTGHIILIPTLRANQSLLFLLNVVCFSGKAINTDLIVFVLMLFTTLEGNMLTITLTSINNIISPLESSSSHIIIINTRYVKIGLNIETTLVV